MLDGWRPATAWLGQAAMIAGQYPGIGDEGGRIRASAGSCCLEDWHGLYGSSFADA